MSSPSADLAGLRIDRGPRKRRRRSPWPGRLLLLGLLAGAVWLFQRPLMGLVDRLRLPAVEVSPLVRTRAGAGGGALGKSANGYIIARTRAALSAEQPGRIVAMNVVEGSRVARGDVVARLDFAEQQARLEHSRAEERVQRAAAERSAGEVLSSEAELGQVASEVDSARAALGTAAADLALARAEHERYAGLVESGFAQRQRLDQAERDLAAAQAAERIADAVLVTAEKAVEAARARLEEKGRAEAEARARVDSAVAAVVQAEAALEKTYVRAPFDGVVVLKEAEVGEVVSPNSQGGSTARGSVATMVDFASLEVQAEVPETTIAAVQPGGPARIYLDAWPEEPYAGRIDRIGPTADRTKATVEVRVAFDDPDGRLRPEMGVRVTFLDDEPDPDAEAPEARLLAPTEAIVRRDGSDGVFVLEHGRVRFAAVQLGEGAGTRRVVESGLGGDERVVLSPPDDLADGARVRVAD